MECAVRRRGPEGDASMAARRRFGAYKEESQKGTRDVVVENEAIREMLDAWNQMKLYHPTMIDPHGDHQGILSAVRDIGYTSEDVKAFCVALTDFQKEDHFAFKTGLFLSALINGGNEEEYIINIEHLEERIERLGFANRKKVTVIGDLGKHTGAFMERGSLTIKGNVGDDAGIALTGGHIIIQGCADESVGNGMTGGQITVKESCRDCVGVRMTGGDITIEGNVYGDVGLMMKGGSITVNGDVIKEDLKARGIVGYGMEGGEIFLNGSYHLRASIIGGRIFHKGRLIVDK
jgi:formylmethanofuran dehydrogenase subunit C